MVSLLSGERQRQIIEYKGPIERREVKKKGAGDDDRNQSKRELHVHFTTRVGGARMKSDALLTRTYHVNECVGDSHRLAESRPLLLLMQLEL